MASNTRYPFKLNQTVLVAVWRTHWHATTATYNYVLHIMRGVVVGRMAPQGTAPHRVAIATKHGVHVRQCVTGYLAPQAYTKANLRMLRATARAIGTRHY